MLKFDFKFIVLALIAVSPLSYASMCSKWLPDGTREVHDTPAYLINPGLQEIKTTNGSATYYINTQGDATRMQYQCTVYGVYPAGVKATLKVSTNEMLSETWDGRILDVKQGDTFSTIIGCDFNHQQPAYLRFNLLSKNSSIILICDNHF